ncbi:AMP-binding protein [Nocardioides zeae]|uniref:Crotonobetaine/carnitine-CoA ligase n=1 Tax=Nocardioides zeae TaxID=1457234 RepID=A0AAJ1U114_9ACTN|nr:AMP-binding protein [Nocardioides zeae]MDQ1105389.1 crotonobetaine/carnitine-CoA ligase [Nocardioides zeae]
MPQHHTTSPTAGDERTASVPRTLLEAATTHPDAPCVRFIDGPSLTYAALLSEVRAVAGALAADGVRPGDRVVLMVGNRVEFLTVALATAWLGAVSVPLNTALRGDALTAMLDLVGPCRLVADGDVLVDVAGALERSGALTRTWVLPATGDEAAPYRLSGLPPWAEPFSALRDGGAPPVHDPHPAVDSDLLAILFTSGTTGPSKGVMWSHRTALAFAENTEWVMGYTADDVIYTCLPLFHINAMYTAFLPGVRNRAPVVVSPRFSASRYWTEIAASGATVTNMLGAIGALLWKQPEQPDERAHRLRLAMVVPFPVGHDAEFAARFGTDLTELYGSTDSGIPLGVPHGERRPGRCGVPAPGWEVVVADEHDRPVPDGTPGELLTRPTRPFVGQLGYWRQPDKTWEAHRNAWFHTGDQVVRHEDGSFSFRDRLKDALRVSGENVSAFEVEHVLTGHPAVAEAAVFAVPGELGEDAVMASVVPEEGHDLDPATLVAEVADRLAYFAVPRYVDVVDALPKTSTQKVRKAELRERGITGTTWDGGQRRRSR